MITIISLLFFFSMILGFIDFVFDNDYGTVRSFIHYLVCLIVGTIIAIMLTNLGVSFIIRFVLIVLSLRIIELILSKIKWSFLDKQLLKVEDVSQTT